MLLDIDQPDGSRPDVIRRIREADGIEERFDPGLPIITFGARGAQARGLDLGADDHVLKPFTFQELRSRIAVVLRRKHDRHEAPVRVGELVIDPARHKVNVGDREVHLTKKEFTLLRALASDPTRVFSKDELHRDVSGLEPQTAKTRTLESHAARLRHKLDPEDRRYVVNYWGTGYRLITG